MGKINQLQALQPIPINPGNCTADKSLTRQILRRQRKNGQQLVQFNLGNGKIFINPIKACEYLLKREYGDTSLFQQNLHEPLYIPPVFQSGHLKRDIATLDFSFKEQMERTLSNLMATAPNYWLTRELKTFLQLQNSKYNTDQIDQNAFNRDFEYKDYVRSY